MAFTKTLDMVFKKEIEQVIKWLIKWLQITAILYWKGHN